MPIKKRKPKLKPKPSRKKPKSIALIKHHKRCDDLYNRLQRDTDEDLISVMWEIMGYECSDAYHFIEQLSARFTCEIKTLQMNGPFGKGATYTCKLTWEDRKAKPKYGYIYPSLISIKTSSRMIEAAILSYIGLCKQAGRFI